MLVVALRAAAVVGTACALVLGTAGTASAGLLQKPLTPQHAVFLVKDLGGGAYWNVTTNAIYVSGVAGAAATEAVVEGATAGSALLTASAQAGTDALLLVNGTVLVPLQERLLP